MTGISVRATARVAPVRGETTWSFLHRVSAAYGLEAGDMAGCWRWVNPLQQRHRRRLDGEVFLDEVAQEQLAAWCGVSAGHLTRALPSWAAGPEALAGRGEDGQGRARWRMGALEWGPVAFACSLCAARHGAVQEVWVYLPQWRRVCVRHGRWLLDVGQGHPLRCVDAADLAVELGRAQRQWRRVARAGAAFGANEGEVFALAHAVVCGWWEREEFWQRETVWGLRLEQATAAMRRQGADPPGWGVTQWRWLARDMVVFPEVVAVAAALTDRRVQRLVAGERAEGLVRGPGAGVRLASVLGECVQRPWLAELEADGHAVLVSWARAVVREQRRAAGLGPRHGWRGVWWVPAGHRPLEVGAGLQLLAASQSADAGVVGRGAEPALVRQERHGQRLPQREALWFTEGLEHARRHVRAVGHLAVPHPRAGLREGFDLGRWLANRRADATSLTAEQVVQLRELDAWWNPPWPISWQRTWYEARTFVQHHRPVGGGNNLAGLPPWLERWLRRQIIDYEQLHEEQRRLLGELGLTEGEVRLFHAWPGRRRSTADGLEVARAYAARHGHLALSWPTAVDGFPLGNWLKNARQRQCTAGRPTRLGRQLNTIDGWWNPPWPVAWQRMWWACRYHLTGLPDDLEWWAAAPNGEHAAAWLREQSARRPLLQPRQRSLVDELLSLAGEVPVWRPRISDAAWQTVSGVLPAPSHTGGRPRSERQILEAIIHIACTAQAWTSLPPALGPFLACRRRYLRWRDDGTIQRICRAALPEQDVIWQQQLAAYIDLSA
ncbi:Helicase associated domain protein [Streptomyces sp. NPDC050534]|uniref:Helicase associated domain protein n=1 Tax=Streptomyces sp. NPDC050534 TaxID=3365625 RepID=UPI00378961C6